MSCRACILEAFVGANEQALADKAEEDTTKIKFSAAKTCKTD